MSELVNDLRKGNIHVWHVSLASYNPMHWHVLSLDEKERASRFVFDEHRHRYITGRASLRNILASYLDNQPEAVTFVYGPRGKPELDSPICFNASHAEAQMLVAVAYDRNLGVDIERIQTTDDLMPVAEHFYSTREHQALNALPPDEQEKAFFRLWTLKEAVLKADGVGITEGLSSIEPLSFIQDDVLRFGDVKPQLNQWFLYTLQAPPGFVASLAVENSYSNNIVFFKDGDWMQKQ